jgi:hypothetical protein
MDGGTDYDAIIRPGGWFEIRDRDEVGQWIATDHPRDVEP